MLLDKVKKALAPLKLEAVADGDYSKTGYHLEVAGAPEQMPALAQALLGEGCFLESLTALDYPEHFTLVYHYASFTGLCRTVVKANLPKGQEDLPPTISSVYPGANWYEREVFDLFGIRFAGHPNMKRLLLPEDWDIHPLLKTFGAPEGDA